MRLRLLAATLFLLALFAGFAVVMTRSPPSPIVSDSPTGARDMPTETTEVAPALASNSTEPLAPALDPEVMNATAPSLPPVDATVLEVIAALDQRARAGEPEAVCRLTAELLRCRNAPDFTTESDKWADMLAHQRLPDDELKRRADSIAETIERSQQVRRSCEGVSKEQIRAVPSYFYAAGIRGHVPSMISFANAVGIGGEDIIADPALYTLYRTHAASMFTTALQSGHPAAVFAWQQALRSRGFHFLAGALPAEYRSPGVAEALSRRIESMTSSEESRRNGQSEPTAEETALGGELYQRYFRRSGWPSALARTMKQAQSQEATAKVSACLLKSDP